MTLRVLSVFGTRPEAIKMAPVVRALAADSRIHSLVCTTGQHRAMLDQVNAAFGIAPDAELDLMREAQGLTHITTAVLERLPAVLDRLQPDRVLVHGDTTTSFAAALAAFYAGVPVGHVEAGLRTHDLHAPWPEEANRQLTGRLADLHFAPTESARVNLLAEGVPADRIEVTGNTVIDALLMARERIGPADRMVVGGLDPDRHIVLVTAHRRENLGSGLAALCEALRAIAARSDAQVVYPVHPNPKVAGPVRAVLGSVEHVHLMEPLDYLPFVALLDRSHLVITDSGGLQEEAPSLGKPVLVVRDRTERPEAVAAGTVRLVGMDTARIVSEVARLLDHPDEHAAMARAINPYGDGKASGRIVIRLLAQQRTGRLLQTVA